MIEPGRIYILTDQPHTDGATERGRLRRTGYVLDLDSPHATTTPENQ